MKMLFRKLTVFLIPILLYCFAAMIYMPDVLSIQYGPNTKLQIHQSFENAVSRDYEILILGNSRPYRGINPSKFYCDAYNFSHDNDNFNQLFHKLNYLIQLGKKFDKVVLGIDYHQFSFKSDTRNYVYGDLLGEEYMKDYEDGSTFFPKLEYYLGNIHPNKLRRLKHVDNKPFLRDNGHFVKYSEAKISDTVERDLTRLDFQVEYFEKMLILCKAHNIRVFMVMLPLRENELKVHTAEERQDFKSFIRSYTNSVDVFYLDYSENHKFEMKDFTDITHFNAAAADRFTTILSADISELTQSEK